MENWPELRSWARGVLCWVSVALSQSAVRVAWQDGLRCSVLAGALGGLPVRAGALGGARLFRIGVSAPPGRVPCARVGGSSGWWGLRSGRWCQPGGPKGKWHSAGSLGELGHPVLSFHELEELWVTPVVGFREAACLDGVVEGLAFQV